MKIPEDLKYAKTHEWIKVEGEIGTCGLTEYAQSELSDIVFVNLKSVGSILTKENAFGTVEGVKAVSDVYVPVGGEIIEINTELFSSPQLVNEDPYGKGWMIKIKITNKEELDELLSPADYINLIPSS